jgi:hypothetical protein
VRIICPFIFRRRAFDIIVHFVTHPDVADITDRGGTRVRPGMKNESTFCLIFYQLRENCKYATKREKIAVYDDIIAK